MHKKIILILAIFIFPLLHAEIVEIHHIDDIRPYVTKNTLCLFDIDDTLIDPPISLGSSTWRNWVKAKLTGYTTDFTLYDALTLHIAKMVPYKTVEPHTALLISDLQANGIPVFAFTARGRTQWYTTDLEGIDRFTYDQLKNVGIDFTKTTVPAELQAINPDYFYNGIIFAQHIKKGDLLQYLLNDLNYSPSKVIFVDDKLDQVKSVEATLKEMGVPFIGFWYKRSEEDHRDFNPIITNIQMEYLLLSGVVISDTEARELAKALQRVNPDAHLKEILEHVEMKQLVPFIPIEF